jgi:hypothetical protein
MMLFAGSGLAAREPDEDPVLLRPLLNDAGSGWMDAPA